MKGLKDRQKCEHEEGREEVGEYQEEPGWEDPGVQPEEKTHSWILVPGP